MPDITIVKLKIRRGTDAQRKSVMLEQGELGYTIDTQRVFVGNGITSGGNPVGNIVHPPLTIAGSRIFQTNAVKGDLVYENSVLWQLSGDSYASASNWANISPKGDGSYITSNGSGQLTIKDGGITPSKLASSFLYVSGGIVSNANGLSANIDNTSIEINLCNQLAIKSTALGRGLSGGSGEPITFFGSDIFTYNGNQVSLGSLPAGIITVDSLSSTFVGPGLEIAGNLLQTVVNDYDADSFIVDTNVLRLKPTLSLPGKTTFQNIIFNQFGQISAISSGVYDTLSGKNNIASTPSIFNGKPTQDRYIDQTIITAISSNSGGSTVSISLSSAGFMSVETSALGIVAIPVFKYL